MKIDLLITNCLLYDPSVGHQDTAPGFAAIDKGLFTSFGSMKNLPADLQGRQTLNADGALFMPGLINCHCHGAMTLFRGLADDLPLMTWLQEHIFPAEAAYVNEEMVYWCSKLAAAEMLLSGTTTVADSYFHEAEAARAFHESGMRAVAAQGIIDFPAPGVADPTENIAYARNYLDTVQGTYPLVQPALFCHSPYTCDSATLVAAKKLAQERGVLLCIHVAETREEQAIIKERHGTSAMRYLADLEVLGPQTIAVHCVWLDSEEQALVAETGTKVVSCPESNMKLGSGTAPLRQLLQKGVGVGLGTDGCASNNDLDLFGEMGSLARLHKGVHLDPVALPASEVLTLATAAGAALLNLPKGCGRLEVGGVADAILIDRNQPHLTPWYGPNLLVYGAKGSDVQTVIVNGRLVVHNRRVVSFDLEEVRQQVLRLAEPLRT